MTAHLQLATMALLLLFVPFVVQAGAIGGDTWRPKPRGLLNNRLGRLIVRRMNLVLLLNGAFAASTYILWRLTEPPYFWIPIILSLPSVIAQIVLTGASGGQSSR